MKLTKLTPRVWSWDDAHPGSRWLEGCPADAPLVWQSWLTDDPATQASLASLLSATEHARLDRLRIPEDQQRFLVARGLLRILLGAHLNVPAERIELTEGR